MLLNLAYVEVDYLVLHRESQALVDDGLENRMRSKLDIREAGRHGR